MWKWTDASQQLGVLQHKKKFKNTDGSYSITVRDKSTGKTVGKDTLTKDDVASIDYTSISDARKNKATASKEELDTLAAFDKLNQTKVSNLMKNKKR